MLDDSASAYAEGYKKFSARIYTVTHSPDEIDDIVLPPKLRDDPKELGADRWLDDLNWFRAHPGEQYRWATGTGSDVALLAKPMVDGELCVRFAKRDADPNQHVSIVVAETAEMAATLPTMLEGFGGLDAHWHRLVGHGHEVHRRREGTACPMASLARLEAADGLARAKSLSRTPLDDPRWNLKPSPPASLRIELLKLPHDTADRHGEPEAADTDRARMIRHKRSTLVRTGSLCDRQRAVLFGSIVHVEKVGPSFKDWVWHDLGIYPAYLDSPGLRQPLGNGHHVLRIAHGRRSSVFHFHVIATAKVAREMAALDPQALDNICWMMAGIVTPIFHLGDKTWLPTFTR